jgi:hypothetical protein
VQDRQVDGSSVRARAHLPTPRPHTAFGAGRARRRHPTRAFTRGRPRRYGCSGPDRSPSERSPGIPSSPSAPRHEVPGFGAVGSPIRLAPGTVAPVLPRVSARQPEPTAGWRECLRLRSLLAANQWIAETSAVVEPILRRPSPHSLPIESLLVPEAKARPISSRGEKTWSSGKRMGDWGGGYGPRQDHSGRGAWRANEEASRRVGDGEVRKGEKRLHARFWERIANASRH